MERSSAPGDGEQPAGGLGLKPADSALAEWSAIPAPPRPPHSGTGIVLLSAFLLHWVLGTKLRV